MLSLLEFPSSWHLLLEHFCKPCELALLILLLYRLLFLSDLHVRKCLPICSLSQLYTSALCHTFVNLATLFAIEVVYSALLSSWLTSVVYNHFQSGLSSHRCINKTSDKQIQLPTFLVQQFHFSLLSSSKWLWNICNWFSIFYKYNTNYRSWSIHLHSQWFVCIILH